MRLFHSLAITDEASIGAARRGINAFAGSIGMDEHERDELDIVVQEIGTNAVRYAAPAAHAAAAVAAGTPTLYWSMLGDESSAAATTTAAAEPPRFHSAPTPAAPRCGVEIFYADRGPGIYDLDRALHDSVSFGGSLGAGFGAMRRMSDEFYIYSTVRRTERLSLSGARRSTHGTAILCRKWMGARPITCDTTRRAEEDAQAPTVGAWTRPRRDETLNGDGYFVRTVAGRTLVAVIDGLGHGAGAHAATEVALASLDLWTDEPLDELVYRVHDALRATRGAVMSVAVIDHERDELQFAGVGNIHTRVFGTPAPAHPVAVNGTLGTRLPRLQVSTHKWGDGSKMVMASDGLSAAWDMRAYPGLLDRPPQMIAGVLMRDYERDTDDATVVVVCQGADEV